MSAFLLIKAHARNKLINSILTAFTSISDQQDKMRTRLLLKSFLKIKAWSQKDKEIDVKERARKFCRRSYSVIVLGERNAESPPH